jgi:hypothetical protein
MAAVWLAAASPGPSASAADYYVSGSAGGVQDGSAANPWRQLSQAVAAGLQPGDVIHVGSGTYNPFAIDDVLGAAGNPITFRVTPGQTATINGGMNDGGNRDGIRIQRSSHLVIEGFTLVGTGNSSTSRAGIASYQNLGSLTGSGTVAGNHTDIVIRNNTISNYGRWGVFTGFTNNVQVLNNTISGSVAEHGVYLSNASTGQLVRGNTVFNNHASGIQLNGDFSLGGGGIISNSVVENNVLFGNGAGGGGALNNEGVQNSIFRNNILYNNRGSGIVLWIGGNEAPNSASSNNNLVVNNTVFQAADALSGRPAMNIDRAFGNTVLNNIFYHRAAFPQDAFAITNTGSGTVSDYNLFSSNFEYNGGNGGLSQWQSLTGGDANSRVLTISDLTAMFADYAGNDFRLVPYAGNPAINAGAAGLNGWTAPLLDFDGNGQPIGAGFDIGAFEALIVPVPEPAAMASAGALALAAALLARRRMARRA